MSGDREMSLADAVRDELRAIRQVIGYDGVIPHLHCDEDGARCRLVSSGGQLFPLVGDIPVEEMASIVRQTAIITGARKS